MNRTTGRVSLTEIGRDYYERCVQILQDLEEADQAAGAQQATPRRQLRVYCHQGIGRFVSPIVADFLTRYPEASVDLRTGHAMTDLVQEAFDLGISPFPPPDSTLVGRRLGTLTLMVCCASAYLEKHPAPQSPADLAGHNWKQKPYWVPEKTLSSYLAAALSRLLQLAGDVGRDPPEEDARADRGDEGDFSGARGAFPPFALPQAVGNASAAARRQKKHGRCPAASATASSRKKSSVQLRPPITSRCRPL
jgi:DNA-binding transcriptional LysR family regulator